MVPEKRLRPSTSAGLVNLLGICTPTLFSSAVMKDKIYDDLVTVISSILNNEHLFLLSNYKTPVESDRDAWLNFIWKFGTQ